MPVITVCPSPGELLQFVLGLLPPGEVDRLAAHVESCDACESGLHALRARDGLLDEVQRCGGGGTEPTTAEVDDLIERFTPSGRIDETARRDFEAAWRAGQPRPIEDALPPAGHALYAATLEELVLIEMEFAGEAGPPPRVEDYLVRFPALDRPAVVARLRAQERRARRPGDAPCPPTTGHGPQTQPDLTACLAPPEAPDEIGRLGPYRVLSVLGSGGMGVVLRAEDPTLRRPVALKVIRPDLAAGPAARQRFLREARSAAALDHENIVHVYQVGEDRGVPFLAMQLLRGESLEERLKREPKLPVAEVLRVGRELAEGLAAAHARGIVHRDIKPGNVWLESHDEQDRVSAPCGRVKILDFGLARAVDSTSVELTDTDLVPGTPAYMAPEQARGEAVDARADLFSLGGLLYRAATGQPPFPGATRMAVFYALANREPTPPSAVTPDVPKGLSDLIVRLLAKDPARRPASARAVSEELARLGTAPPAAPAPAADRPRRRWWPRVAAAVLLVGGAVLAGQVILRITDKEGRVREVTLNPGDKFEVVPQPQPPGKAEPAPTVPPVKVISPSPLDRLKREDIPPEKLALFGAGGDPRRAPAGLVAVLGDGRLAHWDEVSGVCFSPDGKLLATASWDHTAKVWDAATGNLLRDLVGHQDQVICVSFSEGGKLLATGSSDSTVRVWETATGELRHTFRHQGLVHGVAFAPRGETLASASWDGTATLWDAATGKELATLRHPGWVHHAAFSPDGQSLATACEDGMVRAWHLKTRTVLWATPAHQGPAWFVAFSPDGDLLASGGKDRNLKVWGAATGELVKKLTVPNGGIPGLAFRPDGRMLAAAGNDGIARLWDTHTWGESGVLSGHLGTVQTVAFRPDGQVLATGSWDGTVKLWGPDTRTEIRPRAGHQGWVMGLAFSRDGRWLATGGLDHTVRLWQADSLAEKWAVVGHQGNVTALAFSPDGKSLASGGRDNQVRLWDTATAAGLTFSRHDGEVRRVAFSPPDGRLLASASADGSVKLWDPTTDQKRSFRPHNGEHVNGLAFSPNGQLLVTGSPDRTVKLWKADTLGEVRTLTGHDSWVEAVAFHPDGRRVASASDDKSVRVWDTVNGQTLHVLRGHEAHVHDVAFSPDGKWLASCGYDGTARLWDVEAGKELQVFRLGPPRGTVWRLAFSPDGRHLATANYNGTVTILRLAPPPGP